MTLTLKRTRYADEGVFGELLGADGQHLCYTLEHSYSRQAKVPPGEYTCVRGAHRLKGMVYDFTTFEVTGVPGATGILFHKGNWNKDSEGCILVGAGVSPNAVLYSQQAFEALMRYLLGLDQFHLVILA